MNQEAFACDPTDYQQVLRAFRTVNCAIGKLMLEGVSQADPKIIHSSDYADELGNQLYKIRQAAPKTQELAFDL